MDEIKLTIDDFLKGTAAVYFVANRKKWMQGEDVSREKESLVQALDVLKQYVIEKRTSLEFPKLDSDHVLPLPRYYSDYRRLAQEVAQLTFQQSESELFVTQKPDARSTMLSRVYLQVLGAGDSGEHVGLIKNGMLMLKSLEKIALSLDVTERKRGFGNFETYLIVPIANIFLKGGDYERFMKLVEFCSPKGLLQNGVKSVFYDDKNLFTGVEFINQPNLPGFISYSNNPPDKSTTSVIQRPDNHLLEEQPSYWNISTQVGGKPFWGLKPYGKDDHQNKGGYIDTISLNLALRLANSAREGDKLSYEHILKLMAHSF